MEAHGKGPMARRMIGRDLRWVESVKEEKEEANLSRVMGGYVRG